MNSNFKFALPLAIAFAAFTANAEIMDRPTGIKLTERLTLKPYVAISAAYDSDIDRVKDGRESVVWTVNPNLGIFYKAEQWSLKLNIFYQYNAYCEKGLRERNQNNHGYGEDLTFYWANSVPGERGWSVMLTEQFRRSSYDDDLSVNNSTYSRDRQEFKVGAGVERTFGNGLHADVNGGYYWLDYIHGGNSGAYDWTRWNVGAEIGYAFSPWTDLMLAGSYQGYTQDNQASEITRFSDSSQGWTVQGGLGSFATERITYRVLAGYSAFEYGGSNGKRNSGFSYDVSGSWMISDTWRTMLLASSHYQPSEREVATSHRIDSISWGISHSMIRGKLGASFDVAYRRETVAYTADLGYYGSDYDLDILSFRLGLDYTLNRFLAVFANAEYRNQMKSGSEGYSGYDYDRFRIGVGLRLTY